MARRAGPAAGFRVFEGAFGDLEEKALELVRGADGPVAVATANRAQVERLQGLLAAGGVCAGVRFHSSLRHLAESAGGLSVPAEEVDSASSAAVALQALKASGPPKALFQSSGSVSAAASLGGFFERMLLLGISPQSYSIALDVIGEEAGDLAPAVGSVFAEYLRLRSRRYPRAADAAMEAPLLAEAPALLVLYGFYELNPLQRRLVKRLARWAESVAWLTPVHPGMERWEAVTARTRRLVEELSLERPVRVRGSEESRFRPFVRTMLSGGRTEAPKGLSLTVTRGALGTARAVVSRVRRLLDATAEPADIAVVAPEETGRLVARLCHHEGVPCAAALEAPVAETPAGRMAAAVLGLRRGEYHYSGLLEVASSGCLAPECRFDRSGLLALLRHSGVRFDLEDWLAAARTPGDASLPGLAAFLQACEGFFAVSPATPPACLEAFLRLLSTVMDPHSLSRVASALPETLPDGIRLAPDQAEELLRRVLEDCTTVLRKGCRGGVAVITPEAARGGLWPHLLVCDLEEDVFPGMPREDPMLPEALRRRLQLPSGADVVLEQELLFLQAAEAAGSSLDLLRRGSDSGGREVFASPFLDGLPKGTPRHDSAGSPGELLLAGGHPGQIRAREASRRDRPARLTGPFAASVLEAELERISGTPFGIHDGRLGEPPERLPSMLSASLLEAYGRCPFACLAESVWKLKEDPDCTVGSQPDPMLRGTVLHMALEELLAGHGFRPPEGEAEGTLRAAAEAKGLAAQLGSRALMDSFVRREAPRLEELVRSLAPEGWELEGSERHVEGSFAGRPTRGRIDLILRSREGKLLLDFKSGGARSSGQVQSATARGELFQLPIYARLYAEAAGEEPAGAGYLYLGVERSRQPVLQSEDLEAPAASAEERAELFASLMERGFFPPLPLVYNPCRTCGLGDLCRATPEQRLEWKAAADDDARRLKGEEDDG
mgnify:CR=1 FL=1